MVFLRAVRSNNMVTLINFVSIGLLVKGLHISLSKNTCGIQWGSSQGFVRLFQWDLGSNKGQYVLDFSWKTNVLVKHGVYWGLTYNVTVFNFWLKLNFS